MKTFTITIVIGIFAWSHGIAQDIQLVEGSLKLTTFVGVDKEASGTISNDAGTLTINPTMGHPVKIDPGHNLEVAGGKLLVKGNESNEGIQIESSSGQKMKLLTQNSSAGLGGLSILADGITERYYFDDDENYFSIGLNQLSIFPSYTSLEIQQTSATTKAITINGANAISEFWDISILSNGNLALYYNNTFKGQFSKWDGIYSPTSTPSSMKLKAESVSGNSLKISSEEEDNIILQASLSDQVSHLHNTLQVLDERLQLLENSKKDN